MEWIDVNDRLPEENGYYIAFDVSNGVWQRVFYDGKWEFGNDIVTHWMPLPDSPQLTTSQGDEE